MTSDDPNRIGRPPHGSELIELLPVLVRFAYGLTGSQTDAEDLTQGAIESYLRVPRQPRHLRQYLQRSILNSYLRQRDRKNMHTDAVRKLGPVTHNPNPPGSDERTDIARALRILTPTQRAVVIHRYLADESVADTARSLQTPEGSIRRIASEALAILRTSSHFDQGENQ